MSSPIANVEIVAPKAPRVKKPTLPAKYNKFMSFGFWFLNKMDAPVRDQLFPELKLFSTIEDQSAFFQSYLDEATASNKIMRKTVAAFHKPPKVRAEKKSRKSSKPVAAQSDDLIAKLIADANGSTDAPATDATATVQEKPKKSTKKSTKKTEEPATTSDVAPATDAPAQEKPKKSTKKSTKKAEEPVTTSDVAPVADAPVEEKPKKATKKSTKKAEEPVPTTTDAPVADATVQEKPKKTTKKSSKKVEEPVAPTEPVAQDDDSDEIQTRIVTIDGGKQYLIDSEYNLYDINSHEQIGKFDPHTNQPILA
jgi:hypothetical protein